MIIETGRAFDDFSAQDYSRCAVALSNILHAHINGFHIFSPRREDAEKMLDLPDFSQREKAALERIRKQYPQTTSLARSAYMTVLALPDGRETDSPDFPNQKKRIALRSMADADILLPCELLVENEITDGDFYKLLCNSLARAAGFEYVPPIRSRMGGGGGLSEQC